MSPFSLEILGISTKTSLLMPATSRASNMRSSNAARTNAPSMPSAREIDGNNSAIVARPGGIAR